DHGNHLGAGKQIEERAIDLDRLADKAEIEHALDIALGVFYGLLGLFGVDHITVLAAQTDRPFALGAYQGDDLPVDRSGQNHLDDLDCFLIGDAQTALELRLDSHPGQHRADLRAAAVYDDWVDAGLLEKRDVACKCA